MKQGSWKLLPVFYTFTLRSWVWYFPRFILLAARAITGPNIVTTSFSLYRHALMFFNSSLNPAIFGWRMRQIRHAILDTQRKVYTYRKPWFWTVRAILILQSTVLFQVQERHFLAFSFSFNVGWNETLNSVNWKIPIQGSVPFGTSSRWKLHPILAPCEVSIWLRLIYRLCQILDVVRLRPTFDVVRLSMAFKSRWSSTLKNRFCEGRIMLLF